jgi:hypothetical protein
MKQVFLHKRAGWVAGLVIAVASVAVAGAQSDEHGRKWKPLPPTAHIVVTVLKGFNGKPLSNAAVIFHAVRDGKNDGNLEVKTNEEGQATIDVIEVGSHLTVQVIARGFATSANEIDVDGPAKELEVKMLRPRAQISNYVDNDGKAATEKPGIQEPAHEVKPGAAAPASAVPAGTPVDPTSPTAEPAPGKPAPPSTAPATPPPGGLER